MAGAIVNKIWEAMGLNAHNEDEEYYEGFSGRLYT